MPRIEAENIDQHIRLQTQRILDAASQLFAERGYRNTEVRDIASAVGLARNSLYRYYPNKDHILLACLQREMEPHLDRIRELEDIHADPLQRIDAWIDLQLDIAATSCHSMMHMANEIRENSPELRADISALHQPTGDVLATAVASLLAGSGRDAGLVSEMIASMLRSAAAVGMRGGDPDVITRELKDSISRILAQ